MRRLKENKKKRGWKGAEGKRQRELEWEAAFMNCGRRGLKIAQKSDAGTYPNDGERDCCQGPRSKGINSGLE